MKADVFTAEKIIQINLMTPIHVFPCVCKEPTYCFSNAQMFGSVTLIDSQHLSVTLSDSH